MPWSRPAKRMREYILAVRAIWRCWNSGAPLRLEDESYMHTLISPFFGPGPSGYPSPPILLGDVGACKTAMAIDVADGFTCGPLTSALSLSEQTVPALARGRAAATGNRADAFEVCVMPLLHALLVQGAWQRMAELVDDEVLSTLPSSPGSAKWARRSPGGSASRPSGPPSAARPTPAWTSGRPS